MSTENSAKMNFSEIWERVREVAGDASQEQIAEMAGVSKAAVSNWKQTEKIPLDSLFRFAASNQVNLQWLLTGEGERDLPMETESAIESRKKAFTKDELDGIKARVLWLYHCKSLRELQEQIGVHEKTLFNYFSGRAELPLYLIRQICESKDVEIDWLISGSAPNDLRDAALLVAFVFRRGSVEPERVEDITKLLSPQELTAIQEAIEKQK